MAARNDLAPEIEQQVPDNLARLSHRGTDVEHRRARRALQGLDDQGGSGQSGLTAASASGDHFESGGRGENSLLPRQQRKV